MSVIDRVEALGIPLEGALREQPGALWRSWQLRYRAAAIAFDAMCAGTIGLAVGRYLPGNVVVVAMIGAAVFVAGVGFSGGYEVRHLSLSRREYGSIGMGLLAIVAFVMTITFLGLVRVPPLPALLGAVCVALAAAMLRKAQRGMLNLVRARGNSRSRAILVGGVADAARIAGALRESHRHVDLVGVCTSAKPVGTVLEDGVEVIGSPAEVVELAQAPDVDVLLVSPSALAAEDFRRVQWALESTDTQLVVVPEVSEVLGSRIDLEVHGATPMMTMCRPSATQRWGKQTLDRVLGTALFLALAPVILGGMAAVKLTSPGSALFRQVRIGRDGRPFTMLKLRTMSADAERRKESLLEGNEGAGPLFKMAVDPRVTPVGRVLRRFSVDELPQLWNVVRGDMSLVGPRPPLPSEVAVYDSMSVHRLHVKPGLTGLWQVSGRSDLTWAQSIKLDLRYVDNWSIGYDIHILWRTVRAVLGGRGAY